MSYVYRQKLKLSELANLPDLPNRVMIYEPENYLGALYGHYLGFHNFEVRLQADARELSGAVSAFAPHLLIFSADQEGFKFLLRGLTQNFPELKVVTTAYNLSQQSIAELMSLGTLGHINRRFSRPKDLAMLVKTFINN
jgi:hypothetical protein